VPRWVLLGLWPLLAADCFRFPEDTSPPPPDSDPWDTHTEIVAPGFEPIVINEIMVDNRRSHADGTGAYPAWIELHNPGDEPAIASSWVVSDDPGERERHRLEQLSIPPGGFLVLYADGQPELGPTHLDLELDPAGGQLYLFTPTGEPMDGLSYGQQAPDHSLARSQDAGPGWSIAAEPTPGAPNGEEGSWQGASFPGPPAPCALRSDLSERNFLEGALVSFTPHCGAELGSNARIEPAQLPRGAGWDGSTLSWPTGPDSGGRIDFVFAVTTQGESGEVPLGETVTFWVADDPDNPDNEPVEPAGYTEEWGLPVIHVKPWGDIHGNFIQADLHVDGVPYQARIKIRGKTSAQYPKPGYTLRFDEAELPVPWGGSRDHLALITPFDDNSYVRQKLSYDQWAAIAAFWGEPRLSPRTFYAVMYIEGVYQGLFMAIDFVDDQFLEQQGFDPGSHLYKAVEHDANFDLLGVDGLPKESLHDGYDKKEGEPLDDFSDLEALVAFTGHADSAGLIAGAADHLDLQEFMDWYLLVHYANAEDSGGKNAYLARQPHSSVFRYAPWDFNSSWGQNWRTYRRDFDEESDFTTGNKVFRALFELPEREAELWERYRQMAQPGGPYDPATLRALVDGYYALIEPSAQRDWERWGEQYRGYEGWAEARDEDADWTDYQGEKAYLYQWLDDRAGVFAGRR
jgi:spore coat protein H